MEPIIGRRNLGPTTLGMERHGHGVLAGVHLCLQFALPATCQRMAFRTDTMAEAVSEAQKAGR